MKPSDVVIKFTADTSSVAQAARIIAQHLNALADDLGRIQRQDDAAAGAFDMAPGQ